MHRLDLIQSHPALGAGSDYVSGDRNVENDETFLVKLSKPANATLGVAQAQGTITNDDAASLNGG